MLYPITVFNAKKEKDKRAFSPYNDDTFIFNTLNVEPMQFVHILSNNYILNLPLNIKEPIHTYRRKDCLNNLIYEKLPYIILDLDHVDNIDKQHSIINFFKQYKCILLTSRSYNGIDNFNIKGVLFCNIDKDYVKSAVASLQYELIDLCSLDDCVSRIASFNAPNNNLNILLDNYSSTNIFDFNSTKTPFFNNPCTEVKIKVLDNYNNAETIEDLCLNVFYNLGFAPLKTDGNCITFSHPDEKKTPGGYFWFKNSPYKMNHYNSTKSISIYEEVKKLSIYKKLCNAPIDYDKLLNYDKSYKTISINEPYIEVTPNIKTIIKEFLNEKNSLFSIKSPMGTGKSNVINCIINEALQQDMRVLVITTRVSLAEDFRKKYNLKIYNNDNYQIGDSLICQYDSLWKYNIKFFDLVILDEFFSLLIHCRNTIIKSNINVTKFFATLNKKIVIADAFLTGYENKILQNKKNCYKIDNQYRDDTPLYTYTNFNYFIYILLETAKKHKITVSCTSLSIIKAIHLLLNKYGVKVVTLTSETPDLSRKLIYSYFNNSNNHKWDCLIYSPTLTVGVSNLNNVYAHFHYDNSLTADAISSIQMLKRSRKAKSIHMCIQEKINYLKITYEAIRDEYMNNIGKNIDSNYIFELNDYGETRVSKVGKFLLKIDLFKNILEKNHFQSVLFLIKYHFRNEPIIITDTLHNNILLKYQKLNKDNEQALFELNIKQLEDMCSINFDFIKTRDNAMFYKILSINDMIEDCDLKIREDLIRKAFSDSAFIKKCKMLKLAKYFFVDKDLSLIDNIISNSINANDLEMLEFCNKIKKLNLNSINEKYLPCEVNDTLLWVLKRCGYTMMSDKNNLGIRFLTSNPDILKYYTFVRL